MPVVNRSKIRVTLEYDSVQPEYFENIRRVRE